MRAVIQRVSQAKVTVNGAITGEINLGLVVLLGIHASDTLESLQWMAKKIAGLRIFEDENNRMNKSVVDVKGDILLISQFTLYGNAQKGFRPSFIEAARPEVAEPMYNTMIKELQKHTQKPIQTGIFGAMMDVSLINNGPVTIQLER